MTDKQIDEMDRTREKKWRDRKRKRVRPSFILQKGSKIAEIINHVYFNKDDALLFTQTRREILLGATRFLQRSAHLSL